MSPFGKLGEAEVEVRLDNKELDKDIKKVGNRLEDQGDKIGRKAGRRITGGIGRGLKGAAGGLASGTFGIFKKVGAAAAKGFAVAFTAAVALTAGSIAGITRKFIDLNRELREVSVRTGIAKDELEILRRTFEHLGSENALEGVVDSAQEFSLRLNEMTKEGYKLDALLQQLGLSGERLRMMTPTDAVMELIAALQGLENQQERNLIADETMGGSWEYIAGVLGVSNDEMLALIDHYRALNPHLGAALAQAERISNGFDYFRDRVGAAAQELMVVFGPAIEWFIAIMVQTVPAAIGTVPAALRDAIEYFRTVIVPGFMDNTGQLTGALGALNTFMTGIFMGDWKLAWHGIEDLAVLGINSIITATEDLVNSFVKSINKMLESIETSINSVLQKTASLGIIGQLPRLKQFAEGGTLKLKRVPEVSLRRAAPQGRGGDSGMSPPPPPGPGEKVRPQGDILLQMLDHIADPSSPTPYWFDKIFDPAGINKAKLNRSAAGAGIVGARQVIPAKAVMEAEAEKAKKKARERSKAKPCVEVKQPIILDESEWTKRITDAQRLGDRMDYVQDNAMSCDQLYN